MSDKPDAGKPRPSLLPPAALLAVARVLTIGADAYDEGGSLGWRQRENATRRHHDALMRHLLAWADGVELDESGEPHLACVAANALILLDLYQREADR